MRPLFDETETQRRQQLHEQFARNYRAHLRSRLHRRIFGSVRGIFIFLLGAATVTFVVAHQNEIDSLAAQKISHVVNRVQSKCESDPLRKAALTYEKEVEAAAR